MKKFILLLLLVNLGLANYAQRVFIYQANGNKEYLTEVDSLVDVKFHKTATINALKQVLSRFEGVNPQKHIIQNRLIAGIDKNKAKNIEQIKGDKSIKYVNKSLINSNGEIQIATDKVMVAVKNGNDLAAILKKLNITYETVSRIGSGINSYLITLQDGNSIETANLLYETGFFESAQPSFIRFLKMMNEFYPNQWGLNNTGQFGGTSGIDINAPEAWTITRGKPNIRVAVIDQGVDLAHPDLSANLLPGFDATDGGDGGINGACWGNDAHGTACAGIIAAQNNTIGTVGVRHTAALFPFVFHIHV